MAYYYDKNGGMHFSREPGPRKPKGKTLFGYNKDYVEEGSAAEARHVEKLVDDITDGQYDFMTAFVDMKSALNPDEQAMEVYQANQRYCRYMMDCCMDPLMHGINKDTVAETVGMYVGMMMFSPMFRQTVKKEVGQAMLPVMERKVKTQAKLRDFADRSRESIAETIEDVTGRRFKVFDRVLSPDKESAEEWKDRKIQDLHDRVVETGRDGRIPLTPESAATQYLNFGVNAYKAMRKPGADKEQIMDHYNQSVNALRRLSFNDGITKEQLQRNVMAVYGKVAKRHPEIRRCFEQTAYGDVMLMPGEKETGSDGVTRTVWRDQFDPSTWNGDLTPRAVRNPTEHKERLVSFFDDGFKDCEHIEAVVEATKSDKMQNLSKYWTEMMQEDVENCDPEGWDKSDDPYAVTPSGHSQIAADALRTAGQHWAEGFKQKGHGPKDEDRYYKKGRDVSDIPDVEGVDDYGPDYE